MYAYERFHAPQQKYKSENLRKSREKKRQKESHSPGI